jgi:hypothetical protein
MRFLCCFGRIPIGERRSHSEGGRETHTCCIRVLFEKLIFCVCIPAPRSWVEERASMIEQCGQRYFQNGNASRNRFEARTEVIIYLLGAPCFIVYVCECVHPNNNDNV